MAHEKINDRLKTKLRQLATEKGWLDDRLEVLCAALSVEEAIGTPEEQDYPIQRGKETMLQADFRGCSGQAFSREVCTPRRYTLREILALPLESDWQRAVLIASANAIFAAAGYIDRTIHCKNQEPKECAGCLGEIFHGEKVALFGHQPRFLEKLAELGEVRCIDIDPDLIGTVSGGILIEGPGQTDEVIEWADGLLVTGSATVNDTFGRFVDTGKPLQVFGTTGAAMAFVLGLNRFCKKAL
jgi:uncharacterized protein (DUF4213/DUF364 family)